MRVEISLGSFREDNSVDVDTYRVFAEDELEIDTDHVMCKFHVQDDARWMSQRSTDLGRPCVGERMPLEEQLRTG